jgi:hypothetical protein
MKKTVIALAVSTLAIPALALDDLPEEKGFSGFVNLGAGAGSIKSNFLARISGIDLDLSDDTISDLGSPDDEDLVLPAVNVEAGYLFGNKKTRVSIGNDLSDFLQFDRATLLSLRHDFDTVGRMQLALLSTSAGLTTQVWADPYLTGSSRKNTDYTSDGARFTWDKIMGSEFELKASLRKREIDDEFSGDSLDLTPQERQLLDREGDVTRVELGYLVHVGEGRHLIRPSVAYVDRDLDGDAMAQDGYELTVSWVYSAESARFRWVNNASYASFDGDKVNPIFNEVNDSDRYAIASQMFFPKLFGLEKWTPNLSAIWADSDHDIDFNDASGWLVSAGMFRRF